MQGTQIRKHFQVGHIGLKPVHNISTTQILNMLAVDQEAHIHLDASAPDGSLMFMEAFLYQCSLLAGLS